MVGFGDLANIMSKVQDLQTNMKNLQDELANQTYQASSGGGMVTATINGKGELVDLKIDPQTVDLYDFEMLEDLIRAAVNTALAKKQELIKQKMAEVTGGLNLPILEQFTNMIG